MTDKEKFRKEVEKLKSNLIYGACSSQVTMETRCKEEAYNEVLAIIDSLQEEPVSTKDKLLALSDGRLHLGWIDDAKVVEFEECLMQFHEDMNNIPQGTDSLTQLKDTDGVLHSYSKKLMSMAKEEPVSEELGEIVLEGTNFNKSWYAHPELAFKAGAEWLNNNLWKPADSDDLPEYDREVIAILDYDFGHYKVVYAHRPNPNGWNGTNIDTEEKEHFEPVIYDKRGWNQLHVLYWLDAKLPYEENKITK